MFGFDKKTNLGLLKNNHSDDCEGGTEVNQALVNEPEDQSQDVRLGDLPR